MAIGRYGGNMCLDVFITIAVLLTNTINRFFIIFHICLLVIIITAFSLIGGLIFQQVEAPPEARIIEAILRQRNATLSQLRTKVQNGDTRVEIHLYVQEYEGQYIGAIRNGTVIEDGQEHSLWTFEGSVYYCLTTYTLLGYGNVAPKTSLGRVMAIIYCGFSIPITSLIMGEIGQVMLSIFDFLWQMTWQIRLLTRREMKSNIDPKQEGKTRKGGDDSDSNLSCSSGQEPLTGNEKPRIHYHVRKKEWRVPGLHDVPDRGTPEDFRNFPTERVIKEDFTSVLNEIINDSMRQNLADVVRQLVNEEFLGNFTAIPTAFTKDPLRKCTVFTHIVANRKSHECFLIIPNIRGRVQLAYRAYFYKLGSWCHELRFPDDITPYSSLNTFCLSCLDENQKLHLSRLNSTDFGRTYKSQKSQLMCLNFSRNIQFFCLNYVKPDICPGAILTIVYDGDGWPVSGYKDKFKTESFHDSEMIVCRDIIASIFTNFLSYDNAILCMEESFLDKSRMPVVNNFYHNHASALPCIWEKDERGLAKIDLNQGVRPNVHRENTVPDLKIRGDKRVLQLDGDMLKEETPRQGKLTKSLISATLECRGDNVFHSARKRRRKQTKKSAPPGHLSCEYEENSYSSTSTHSVISSPVRLIFLATPLRNFMIGKFIGDTLRQSLARLKSLARRRKRKRRRLHRKRRQKDKNNCAAQDANKGKATKKVSLKKDESDDDGDETSDEDATDSEASVTAPGRRIEEKAAVPILMTLSVCFVFIAVGALALTGVSQNLGYFDSFWFIFISVITIGYGDVVPTDQALFVGLLGYIFIGLSIMSNVVNECSNFFSTNLDKSKAIGGDALAIIVARKELYLVEYRSHRAREHWDVIRIAVRDQALPEELIEESRKYKANIMAEEKEYVRWAYKCYYQDELTRLQAKHQEAEARALAAESYLFNTLGQAGVDSARGLDVVVQPSSPPSSDTKLTWWQRLKRAVVRAYHTVREFVTGIPRPTSLKPSQSSSFTRKKPFFFA